MTHQTLIDDYLAGPQLLREAVAGMTAAQLKARPLAGQWSTLEVVCHIADFEPVYADRMKRILAEHLPVVAGGDPDRFAANLAYHDRDVDEELDLIEVVRRQMARILRTLGPSDFQRMAIHSADGPLTLETLLRRITDHVPHHVRFIEQKRSALA